MAKKLTYEMVIELLQATEKELATMANLKTLGFTPAKIRDKVLKDRKDEEKDRQRKQKEKEIAKQATEKIKQSKDLFNDFFNLPKFENYDKVLFKIKNKSHYPNFKGRIWEIYGQLEIQGEIYVVTLEYDKQGNFALPCFINKEDIHLTDEKFLMIDDYEKDDCLSMEYERVDE